MSYFFCPEKRITYFTRKTSKSKPINKKPSQNNTFTTPQLRKWGYVTTITGGLTLGLFLDLPLLRFFCLNQYLLFCLYLTVSCGCLMLCACIGSFASVGHV